MKISTAFAVAIALAGLAVSAPVYATGVPVPVRAFAAKTKVVKFNVRNDTSTLVELKVGDQVMSLDPGKTLALKLPVGTKVLMNNATPKHQAGELIAEASPTAADLTFAIS
jgi:hypothetical protein